jgi:hypothetical protein
MESQVKQRQFLNESIHCLHPAKEVEGIHENPRKNK